MGDGKGLEVLMTDGWPTMPPIDGGWEWAVLIGPVESVEEKECCVRKNGNQMESTRTKPIFVQLLMFF